MTCTNYLELSQKEKIEMIGKIVHIIQSDNETFNKALMLIKKAEQKGLLEGITINPSLSLKEIDETRD